MGKGVNFADTDDAKENYIMTAEDASCVEVYWENILKLYYI